MINIKNSIINVSNFTIKLKILLESISDEITLTLKLDAIGPTNYDDTVMLVESLDWSNVKAGRSYHLESGVLIETPKSFGPTYVFNYTTFTWEDTRSAEEMWTAVKLTRNNLLNLSDWTQMPDVSLATKSAWAVYRQALRDITNQTDPFNIVWPTAPGG